MLTLRRSTDRGAVNLGWLDSRHTFSFGSYQDPNHMGFGKLRVINEDQVMPGKGFLPHGHEDMEILSYVLDGELEHQDSIGNGSVIRPGDVQRMSAGTGIRHSEFNGSQQNAVHFLQIWIIPGEIGIDPSYEQKNFTTDEKQGTLRLVASPTGRDGSVIIHQNIDVYATILNSETQITHDLASDGLRPTEGHRIAWVQVARGSVQINGETLSAGDGASIVQESQIRLQGLSDGTELLLFDMAA
jgi:quercetin 2,3-dioxygenase